jgi:hypothetical protein
MKVKSKIGGFFGKLGFKSKGGSGLTDRTQVLNAKGATLTRTYGRDGATLTFTDASGSRNTDGKAGTTETGGGTGGTGGAGGKAVKVSKKERREEAKQVTLAVISATYKRIYMLGSGAGIPVVDGVTLAGRLGLDIDAVEVYCRALLECMRTITHAYPVMRPRFKWLLGRYVGCEEKRREENRDVTVSCVVCGVCVVCVMCV